MVKLPAAEHQVVYCGSSWPPHTSHRAIPLEAPAYLGRWTSRTIIQLCILSLSWESPLLPSHVGALASWNTSSPFFILLLRCCGAQAQQVKFLTVCISRHVFILLSHLIVWLGIELQAGTPSLRSSTSLLRRSSMLLESWSFKYNRIFSSWEVLLSSL